jgi:hypothetical protein
MRGSAGGKARGITERREAISKYYFNPIRCLNCGGIIPVPEDVKISVIKRKKFCSKSCAATYNNKIYPKKHSSPYGRCQYCGSTIVLRKKRKGGYFPRKYCNNCYKRMSVLNQNKGIYDDSTKGELLKRTLNWQSARSIIRFKATQIYYLSGKPLICKICGYSDHVDIAHVKRVADFSNDTLLITINHIDNLVALCPNHHWEYDHKILNLPQIFNLEL